MLHRAVFSNITFWPKSSAAREHKSLQDFVYPLRMNLSLARLLWVMWSTPVKAIHHYHSFTTLLVVSELDSDDDGMSKWGQHLIRDGPNETDSIYRSTSLNQSPAV